MATSYLFHIKSASKIRWSPGHFHGATPNLYLQIEQDKRTIHRTTTIRRTLAPHWDHEQFTVSSDKLDTTISLKLFHDASVLRDTWIGSLDVKLDTLFCLYANIQLLGGDGKPACTVSVRVERITEAGAQKAIDDVQNAVLTSDLAAATLTKKADDLASGSKLAASNAMRFSSGLQTILGKLDIIVKFGNELSQVHPYANAAWKILTAVYNVVEKQQETDENVIELIDTMTDVYSFAKDVDFLSDKITRLEKAVEEITRQTLECAIFIQEYIGEGFSGRLMRDTLSNKNQEIQGLSDALLKAKDSFDHELSIQSVFFSAKMVDDVHSLVQAEKLRALNPLNIDASLRSGCLAGTRQDVVAYITEWLTTESQMTNILWLHGVAGAGKSTISTTISESFRSLHRLGASLFFDRNNPTGSTPGGVIRTIAYGLASSDALIKTAICQAITEDPTLATAPIRTQFQKLLLEPLLAARARCRGPIIIILDALDECGNADSREGLLSMIANDFSQLPSMFRFLIVSRPDSDIAGQFHGRPHISDLPLTTTEATQRDILAYLRHGMQEIRTRHARLGSDWPGEVVIRTLAEYSGGLFIWASTVCRFIRLDPKKALASVLAGESASNLDSLYAVALRNSADWEHPTFAGDAGLVLGAIVLSREPLTDRTIDRLLGFEEGRASEVLENLGCVVQWEHGHHARVLHASFSDYLTDRRRSGDNPWFIDKNIQSKVLSQGCLHILNSQLRFNICALEDSHVLNVDVPNLPARIAEYIPAELKYASLFWGHHFADTPLDNEVLEALKRLLYCRFLYWLEILSLLDQVRLAIESISLVRNHVESDKAFQDFLWDAHRFLAAFSHLIVQSVPHIYISALPLAPRQSLIRTRFISAFPNTLRFTGSAGNDWSSMLKVFKTDDPYAVYSAAFSPDGKQIVSVSGDSMYVWDSETGDILAGPCKGNSPQCSSVAFSSDGKRIVVASGPPATLAPLLSYSKNLPNGALRVWDAKTGALLAGPFGDHIFSSVVFSPDGQQIISGSYDHGVRVWDATGTQPAQVLEGHTDRVLSVAVSPHGKRIASAGADNTVRVWNPETGTAVGEPFRGHNEPISSISFSVDGTRIVSGSDDKTLRIWDTDSGSLVAGPFQGTSRFLSVAFSLDGMRIVSGSTDATVRVWDAADGTTCAGPFQGHTAWVAAVAFSPDGKRIMSAGDRSVRVWDVDKGVINEHYPAHNGFIYSVEFSPDGKRIISVAADKTLRVWDSETGAPVGGPSDRVASLSTQHHPNYSLQVWKCEPGFDHVELWQRQSASRMDVDLSSDARYIVVARGNALEVLGCDTGDLIFGPFVQHTSEITCVIVSPDSRLIASISDGLVAIWEPGSEKSTVLRPSAKVGAIVFSPDSGNLAAASWDGIVRVWDAETGALITDVIHEYPSLGIAFSPDVRHILCASIDRALRLYDSTTGTLVGEAMEGHTDALVAVGFSQDGKKIVSAGDDRTIRVWDLEHTAVDGWESNPHFKEEWIMDSPSNHILWIPPWLRQGLHLPRNSLVICSSGATKLDLSQFVHGTEWQKCIDPRFRDNLGTSWAEAES
ncbi:WD40 repeat-like protein [Mycena sanguinolenta]|uniref:WD40 repeat-like protein n=1 Tax=Mycena sanguinolenta TaxID=230812 RepID=A0A8H6YSF4_9AGAR|nr:WD40 repeat-like protein [Mycena sanguinolenta]